MIAQQVCRVVTGGAQMHCIPGGCHALVALTLPGASPVHKATIVPHGHALGMVTQVRHAAVSVERFTQGGLASPRMFMLLPAFTFLLRGWCV